MWPNGRYRSKSRLTANRTSFPVLNHKRRDPMMPSDTGDRDSLDNYVGPVIRAGDFADVVARSIEDDNPGKEVRIIDRRDYVLIHTAQVCRLAGPPLEQQLL